MGKRKSYFSKVDRLIRKAKEEVLCIMAAEGIDEVNIEDWGVYILEDSGGEVYRERLVRKVIRERDREGYHLGFEADGENFWYVNRLLWLDIHEAVFKEKRIYSKIFSSY